MPGVARLMLNDQGARSTPVLGGGVHRFARCQYGSLMRQYLYRGQDHGVLTFQHNNPVPANQ